MTVDRSARALTVAAVATLALTACGSGEDEQGTAQTNGEVQLAPRLNIAVNAQPPSMDPVSTTTGVTRDTAMLIMRSTAR